MSNDRIVVWARVFGLLLGLVPAHAGTAQAPAEPEKLHWTTASLLPPGALLAVISGDPTAPGQCTMLVSMPNGYRFPPHYHPSYEHIEVREGTILAGMGDKLDPKQTKALTVGDSATAPAGIHHFSIAKGKTLLAVTFEGPYTITYIHAEDAPQARVFPMGY